MLNKTRNWPLLHDSIYFGGFPVVPFILCVSWFFFSYSTGDLNYFKNNLKKFNIGLSVALWVPSELRTKCNPNHREMSLKNTYFEEKFCLYNDDNIYSFYISMWNKKNPVPPWLGDSVGYNIVPCPKSLQVSILDQGSYLGCRLNPQLGHILEATDQCFSRTWMFLSLSTPPQNQ